MDRNVSVLINRPKSCFSINVFDKSISAFNENSIFHLISPQWAQFEAFELFFSNFGHFGELNLTMAKNFENFTSKVHWNQIVIQRTSNPSNRTKSPNLTLYTFILGRMFIQGYSSTELQCHLHFKAVFKACSKPLVVT